MPTFIPFNMSEKRPKRDIGTYRPLTNDFSWFILFSYFSMILVGEVA